MSTMSRQEKSINFPFDSELSNSKNFIDSSFSQSTTNQKGYKQKNHQSYQSHNHYYYPRNSQKNYNNAIMTNQTGYISNCQNTHCGQGGNNYKYNSCSSFREEFLSKTEPINPHKSLLNKYKDGCNFFIFVREASPYIKKNLFKKLKEMTIEEYFSIFEEIGIMGSEMSFILNQKEISNVSYNLTISSFNIIISYKEKEDEGIQENSIKTKIENDNSFSSNNTKSEEFDSFLTNLESKYKKINVDFKEINDINSLSSENNSDNNQKEKNNSSIYYINENLQITVNKKEREIIIGYYESKPYYNRLTLTEQILNILELLDLKGKIKMSCISSRSWYSFLWYPIRATHNDFISTSFIVYYQLTSSVEDFLDRGYKDYYEIPLLGILPIKLKSELWLCNLVRKFSDPRLRGNTYYRNKIGDFQIALSNSIVNFIYIFIIY